MRKICLSIASFLLLASLLIPLVYISTSCATAKDASLQMKIREELRKDRNIQADKLTINVHKGVVTISGELYTQEEIDRVIAIVSAIDGVVEVKNLMTLPDNYNAVNPTFLDPF